MTLDMVSSGLCANTEDQDKKLMNSSAVADEEETLLIFMKALLNDTK